MIGLGIAAKKVLPRLAGGIAFSVAGLQLFTGPYTMEEFAWAALCLGLGVFVLASLAASPMEHLSGEEIGRTFFSLGRTADDSLRRAKAFRRLGWLLSTSAVVWLVLWASVFSRVSWLAQWSASVPFILLSCVALTGLLFLGSTAHQALALARRQPPDDR